VPWLEVLEARCLLDYGVHWHTFVTGSLGDTEEGSSVILYLPDRTILLGGWGTDPNNTMDFALAHLTDGGSILNVHVEPFEGTGPGKNDTIKGIALQGNHIIAVGQVADPNPGGARAIGVMRFDLATLMPDRTFGANGRFEFQFDALNNSTDLPRAVLVQPDGKIIVAGTWGNAPQGGSNFAVARVEADGSALDSGFNNGSGINGFQAVPGHLFNGATALAFRYDDTGAPDRILASGVTGSDPRRYGSHDSVVASFHLNGMLDTSFASGASVPGVFVKDFSGQGDREDGANDLLVQPNGMIVTAGFTNNQPMNNSEYNWAIMRIKRDGSDLDPTFGCAMPPCSGTVKIDFAGANSYRDLANAVALQDDGKIVAAGQAHAVGSNPQFAAARLTSTGQLDSDFNSVTTGKLTFNYWPPACLDPNPCMEDVLEDVAIWAGAPNPVIIGAGYHRNSPASNPEDAAVVQLCQGCQEPMPPPAAGGLLQAFLGAAGPLGGPSRAPDRPASSLDAAPARGAAGDGTSVQAARSPNQLRSPGSGGGRGSHPAVFGAARWQWRALLTPWEQQRPWWTPS
jgi:uncharacterized delta-60 repeat protein